MLVVKNEDVKAYLQIGYGLINYLAASQQDSQPIAVYLLPRNGA